MLAIASVVGVVFLIIWLREPSADAYARTQVQALFVNDSLKRTGTVKTCRLIGPGNAPGEEIWACSVAGRKCVRTFKFAVDHEYGTVPYDQRAFDATNSPCRATTNH